MWAMNLAVNLVVQVLFIAVHNHYKRIYKVSSNKWLDFTNWIRLFNYRSCGDSLLFLRHEILISWILCASFYSQFGDLALDLAAVADAGFFDGPVLPPGALLRSWTLNLVAPWWIGLISLVYLRGNRVGGRNWRLRGFKPLRQLWRPAMVVCRVENN